MNQKENGFRKRLLATFKIEAEEHIRDISSGLVDLEKTPAPERQMTIIEALFREAHSLKGAARAVNLMEVEAICRSLEGVFAALKRREITLMPTHFDILHLAADTVNKLLLSASGKAAEVGKNRIRETIRELEGILKGSGVSDQGSEVGEETRPISGTSPPDTRPLPLTLSDTVRISTTKLDSILRQAEEMLSIKLATSQRLAELRGAQAMLEQWKKKWAKFLISGSGFLNEKFKNPQSPIPNPQSEICNPQLGDFLDENQTHLKALESKLKTLVNSVAHDHRVFDGMVDSLLEDMKKVLMLPFSSLLEIFPKIVRELSREQNKEADLVIQGGEVEMDRRILEEMKDPLIHLVRNCIDHGIENPRAREQKKKPSRGTITIAILPKNGNKAEILISDDGAGIDVAKVRQATLKLGLGSQEETSISNEEEALAFIFQSGVSTSPIITDISGRGIGLAIVQEKVKNLGGTISVETHPRVGTTFRMVLPLTLATFRGILVRVNEHHFIIPATNVARVVRINKEEIKTVENRETIQLNEVALSLVRLADVLELPRKSIPEGYNDNVHIVVLGAAEKYIAFLVDEILNEQEVLVKNLGKQLSRVRNIAGATVSGTGRVVPILNVSDLIKTAVQVSGAPMRPLIPALEGETVQKKCILVVEDSITARSLLKNILESAGYHVKTAVDGVEAFTTLRTEALDLVVSDVDMPRMSGFDLTAKIRADKKLSELPVVLVTALESREDRERGVDVGANAYIVKSSFDQSNLLEVVGRLI